MRMKICTKVMSGFAVMLVFLAVLGIVVVLNVSNMNRQFEYVVKHDAKVIAIVQELRKLVVDMETGQRGFIITQRDQFLEPYNKGYAKFNKLIVAEKELVSDNPSQVMALEKIEALVDKWNKQAAQPEIDMARKVAQASVNAGFIQEVLLEGTGKKIIDEIRSVLDGMIESYEKDGNIQGAYLSEKIAKAMVDQETGERGFLVTGKREFLEPYESGQKLFNTSIRELRKLNSNANNMADMKRNIDKVEELAENWIKKAANPEIAARRMINKHPESLKDVSALLIAETGKRILDQIRGEFEQFIEVEERLTAERQANAADSFLTTRDVTITIMITSLVFGGLIAMFITRAITKPVHKLVDALASVGAGDLTTEVKIKSRDEIGELAVSFNQMVGDLKESNCALRESEERFRSLVENTTDWIWEVNEHARYTYVSPQVSKILSYEPDEVVGMTPFDLMTSEDQQRLRKQFVEIAARQEPFSRLENANLHKDGHSVVILETSGVPIFGTDGLFKGYRGIDRDITERKKMEEILLESEKLKSLGIITAGIAHEFNNILAVMVGSAELLEGGFKNEKELKKVLRSIITAGDDGAEIVRNMLKFAKSEGKDTADYIFFDISYLINEAIDFAAPRWRNMAQAEGIDYKIDREGMREIPEARCNTTELREVFTNIINNALDAMPDGGTLSFSTWSDDGSVFVSITDTGKGMSEGVKKKIFDPFFTTRRPLGTGLGMSVSYGVIMRHGGRIEVESEVGKGTTFTLSIPIGKDVLQKTVPPEPVRQISAKKLHILVVDDSDEMCVIMDNFITKAGHNIKTIDNGADAIELAGKEDFDLILCDLAMPNVYGYDVISAINKSDKRQKIGIMTGWEEKLKPVDDEEFKVDFVIKKPFKHSELAKHINELFGADCKK